MKTAIVSRTVDRTLISALAVFLVAALPLSTAADPCCLGRTGNIDCDPEQTVDMGDLTVMIDRLFISLDSYCCPGEADVDLSGGTDPVAMDIDMGDLTVLLDHLFISLNPLPWCPGGPPDPSGQMIGNTGCKDFPESKSTPPGREDCIAWQYDETEGTLALTHINAGFNCCPWLAPEITIEGDVITIDEISLEDSCYCLCLFDIEYEIVNLPAGEYRVVVIEYLAPAGEYEQLDFRVDFTATPSGSECVWREHYPWAP